MRIVFLDIQMVSYLRWCFISRKPVKITPLQDSSGGINLIESDLAATAKDAKIDFAYNVNTGYGGLILHAISPAWAGKIYPWLATDPVEKLASLSLLICSGIASMPCITTKVPLRWTQASWGVYLSALHRTSLIDLRLLRLLLRQFDVWYTIANMGKWGAWVAPRCLARGARALYCHFGGPDLKLAHLCVYVCMHLTQC